MRIKIGIISDLHCRYGKEKYQNQTTYLYSESLRKPINHHPIESLKNFINKNEELKCDYLICLGDISEKMDKQGLISGWGFIKELNKAFGSKRIISLVGNHDVDFKGIHLESDRFNTITRDSIKFPIINPSCEQNFWDKQFCIYEDESLIVLIVNTVYNFEDEKKAKNPIIKDQTLADLAKKLSELKDKSKPKIVICHHHPYKFSNYQELYKDGDVLDNGDKFIKLMDDMNFRLIIHGHKHIPRMHTIDSTTIFCTGSFASLRNTAEYKILNTCHILDVEMNNFNMQGRIYTYEYKHGTGWRKSQDPEADFPAITGFGYLGDISTLAKRCKDWLLTQPGGRGPFKDLENHIVEIKYLSPKKQLEFTQKLLSNYKIEFSPALQVGPNSVQEQI